MLLDSIPIEVVSETPGVFLARIDVLVDGRSRSFLLDTGAATSSIESDEHTNKYPNIGSRKSKGVSGIAKECDVIQPNELSFGMQKILKPHLERCDRNILGIDILGNKVFQISLECKSLNYLSELPEGGTSEKMRRLSPGHITIPIRLEKVNVDVLFDTGADATIADQQFVEKHPELFEMVRCEDGFDVNGNKIPSRVYEVKNLSVGSLNLTNVEMAAFDYGDFLREKMDGASIILGNNVISNGKWSFDLSSEIWTVTGEG